MSRVRLRPNQFEQYKICSECANRYEENCPKRCGLLYLYRTGAYKKLDGVSYLMSEKDGKGCLITITDCAMFERCFFLSDIFKFLLNI